ncbi:MAG: YlmC/YmxH family sporulation protein, partial [Clostridiales bacterium]
MFRISELRHKDVINNTDGKRLGYIRDVDVDLKQGVIKSLILPGENRMVSIFSRGNNEDIIISWSKIKKIGVDVILVEIDKSTPLPPKKTKGSFFFKDIEDEENEDMEDT